MSAGQLHLVSPEHVSDFIQTGRLNDALAGISGLVGAELYIHGPGEDEVGASSSPAGLKELPVRYRGQAVGQIRCQQADGSPSMAQAAGAIASLLEHLVEREVAISDLADEMMASYEELNILYALLPSIATKVNAPEIGQLLVDETARALRCGRVSVLVLDDEEENLRVLAARGVPPEAYGISIPVSRSIAGHALRKDDGLVIANILDRPDLLALSQGQYESDSFAVVRVPMSAHGKAIGVITATERVDEGEFTARDRKLLEGISSLGASALVSCKLHAAVSRQMMSTIRSLVAAVDAKDQYIHDHSDRVARLCVVTGRELGVHDETICREFEFAGLLHDVGKIGVPDSILSKKGLLTFDEFEIAKTHVHIGARIVGHIQGFERVAQAILHHHERHDGLGYPSGLAGDRIPMGSRLISVADVFDTLVSNRPYRKAIPAEQALQELRRCTGTQLDPAVVEAFTEVIRREKDNCIQEMATRAEC